MSDKIKQALQKLDTANDEHWTADGLPRIDAVEEFLGESVKRKDITEAAPQFTRETAAAEESSDDSSEDGSKDDDPKQPTETETETETDVSAPKSVNLNPIEVDYSAMTDPEMYVTTHLKDRSQEELKQIISSVESDVETTREKIKELKKEEEKMQGVLNVTRRFHDSKYPAPTFEENQMSHLKESFNRRFKEAQSTQATIAGLPSELAKNLVKKAQIDKAFEHKSGFGTKRPNFNPNKTETPKSTETPQGA